MGLVQMNGNGPMTNGLVELNQHMQYEHKGRRDEVRGEGQLSEEDESWVIEDREELRDGWQEAVQSQGNEKFVLQRPLQQPQGQLVQWERFLPLRSLKVLLVENDGSTCRLVSELLRNCGYEGQYYSWYKMIFLSDMKNKVNLISK